MGLDEALEAALDRAMAEPVPNKQCTVCRFVKQDKISDEQMAHAAKERGVPWLVAFLRDFYGAAPSEDSIRRHLKNHVD